MGPAEDPGYLALAAGEDRGGAGLPVPPEEELVRAGGYLGSLHGGEISLTEALGDARSQRVLAVVVRCIRETRRSAGYLNPYLGTIYAELADRAAAYLREDPRLGGSAVERLRRSVRRELANARRREGRLPEARAILDELEGSADGPTEAAEQAAYRAAVAASGGHLEAAVENLEAAISRLPEAAGRLRVRLAVQAGCLAGWYDTDRGLRWLRRAASEIEGTPTPRLHEVIHLVLAWWTTATIDAVRALETLPRVRSSWLAVEDPWGQATLRWTEARLLTRLDHLAAADTAYDGLWADLFEPGFHLELLVMMLEWLALVSRRGRRTFAAQILNQAQDLLGVWRKGQWITDQLQGLRAILEDPRELAGRIPHDVRRLRRGWYEGTGERGTDG